MSGSTESSQNPKPARDSGIGDINSPKPGYPARDSGIGDINSPKPEYPAQDSDIGDINSPKPGYPAQDSGIGDINPAIRIGTEKNATTYTVEPPIRDGININPTAHFVEPGPTNTERYSQVSEGNVGEYSLESTLKLGPISEPKPLTSMSTLGFLEGTCTTRSSEIPDEISTKARTLVSKEVEVNPEALGIVLLVHNKSAHPVIPDLDPLHGIERGTLQLKNAFANLGLCVVRLENPSKQLLEAIIEVLSSPQSPVTYPQSYRYVFFYTTGHGAERVFFTKDGSVSYYDVVDSFKKNQTFVQKYFIFDSCHGSGLDRRLKYPNGDEILPNVPELNPGHENRIIYATTVGTTAWGPGEGHLRISFMTMLMIELLAEPISFDELIRRLQKAVPLEVKKWDPSKNQYPTSHDATSTTINLSEERNQKMQPSINQLVFEDGANLTVQLKRPLALNNENSVYETCQAQYRHIGETEWKDPLEQRPSASTPPELPATVDLSVFLPTDEHTDNQQVEFRVVAHYKGDLVVPSEPFHTVLPGLVRPSIDQPTFQDGGYVANFSVSLKKPLAVNNENSHCETCVLQYRRTSDQDWEALKQRPSTDVGTTPTVIELPTTVGLSVFLPTDERIDSRKVQFSVVARYNGGLVVESETIHTALPSLEISKRRVGVCIAITIVLLLAFVFSVFTIFLNVNAYSILSTQATTSVTASVGVMAHGIQSDYHNFAFSFIGWYVRLCDSNQHDQSSVVYCAAYNSTQLNNNRYFKNLTSDDTFVKLNRTFQPGRYPLPISLSTPLYLLESSQVFVNVCPSASNPACGNSFHKMTFLVFYDRQARDDFVYKNSSSHVAYKEEITFEDGGVCQNHSITINQSTLVYFAFSTADVICFKEFSGSINQRLYSAEGLDLKNVNNELIDGKISVTGNASSHLVCVAPNSEELDELCVNNQLVFNGPFGLFAIPIILLILFICCRIGWCMLCKMFARKREKNRAGYDLIPSKTM